MPQKKKAEEQELLWSQEPGALIPDLIEQDPSIHTPVDKKAMERATRELVTRTGPEWLHDVLVPSVGSATGRAMALRYAPMIAKTAVPGGAFIGALSTLTLEPMLREAIRRNLLRPVADVLTVGQIAPGPASALLAGEPGRAASYYAQPIPPPPPEGYDPGQEPQQRTYEWWDVPLQAGAAALGESAPVWIERALGLRGVGELVPKISPTGQTYWTRGLPESQYPIGVPSQRTREIWAKEEELPEQVGKTPSRFYGAGARPDPEALARLQKQRYWETVMDDAQLAREQGYTDLDSMFEKGLNKRNPGQIQVGWTRQVDPETGEVLRMKKMNVSPVYGAFDMRKLQDGRLKELWEFVESNRIAGRVPPDNKLRQILMNLLDEDKDYIVDYKTASQWFGSIKRYSQSRSFGQLPNSVQAKTHELLNEFEPLLNQVRDTAAKRARLDPKEVATLEERARRAWYEHHFRFEAPGMKSAATAMTDPTMRPSAIVGRGFNEVEMIGRTFGREGLDDLARAHYQDALRNAIDADKNLLLPDFARNLFGFSKDSRATMELLFRDPAEWDRILGRKITEAGRRKVVETILSEKSPQLLKWWNGLTQEPWGASFKNWVAGGNPAVRESMDDLVNYYRQAMLGKTAAQQNKWLRTVIQSISGVARLGVPLGATGMLRRRFINITEDLLLMGDAAMLQNVANMAKMEATGIGRRGLPLTSYRVRLPRPEVGGPFAAAAMGAAAGMPPKRVKKQQIMGDSGVAPPTPPPE